MSPLSAADARRWLVHVHGLARPFGRGRAAVPRLLHDRRCIQLDPLDQIGTSADLVALARIDQLRKGQVYEALLPGHAFEHFAKERCLLPAHAFPGFRDHVRETGWWQGSTRLKRVDEALMGEVLAELRERGPLRADQLADRGRVEPLDWSGWTGTKKATTMAIEVLWMRCDVVVCGRDRGGTKIYDVPERALPAVHDAPGPEDFGRWALMERVWAAGLLARATGPQWGQLRHVRASLPDQLIAEGVLEEVVVEGSRRPYLAPAGFRDVDTAEPDDRLRILGPLDPLLWDRKLVRQAFGFDYVWEVYKPKAKRQWGYYVCPLLHRGVLVGRLEGVARDGVLTVEGLWAEAGVAIHAGALERALHRHAKALGVAWSGSLPSASP